jgi:hypothetical protein
MPLYTKLVAALAPPASRGVTTLMPIGTSSIITALSDSSDSTYGREAAASRPADYQVAAWPTLAVGERIVSIVPYVRSKSPGSSLVSIAVGGQLNIGNQGGPTNHWALYEGISLALPGSSSTIADHTIAPQIGQFLNPALNAEWSSVQYLPTLTFRDATSVTNRAYIYKAGVYIYTLKAATIAAPSAPSGTVTTTQHPTLTATASAIVESWQLIADGTEFLTGGSVEMSVYRYDDVGTATSPPAGTSPVWSSLVPFVIDTYIDGTTPSTLAVSQQITDALANDTYVLYVRVSRDHPSGQDSWSAYQSAQWVQSVTGPNAPSVTLAPDDDSQSIGVFVTAASQSGYDSTTAQVDVQRLVGGLWREVRGMTGVGVTVDAATYLGDDLECDRDVDNVYRVRLTMLLTADGTLGVSTWGPADAGGPATQPIGWNLKAVNLPASSWLEVGVLVEPPESSQMQATVLAPLDRVLPVVLRGVAAGASGSLDFIASGQDDLDALAALLVYGDLVYLETAFGDAKWLAITDCSWKRQGTADAPRRTGTITYSEVDSGLATYLV